MNPEDRVEEKEKRFPSWKAFLNLNSSFSAFLSCLCLYSYRALSIGSGSNLNSWPMWCVFAPWGGETVRWTDEKQLKPNPHRLLLVRSLFGYQRVFGRKSQQLLSCCGHSFSDHVCCTSGAMILILYRLCVVYCSNDARNFQAFCVFFLWGEIVERSRRVQLTGNKQQTCIAITVLDYLDDDLGDSLLLVPYTGICSQIKWNLSYEGYI